MKVYGWCLMGNHVHLLIGEGNESLSVTMKHRGELCMVLQLEIQYNRTFVSGQV